MNRNKENAVISSVMEPGCLSWIPDMDFFIPDLDFSIPDPGFGFFHPGSVSVTLN